MEPEWLLNGIEEVHEFVFYSNYTEYVEAKTEPITINEFDDNNEAIDDSVFIMLATSEGATAPDSVIRKSEIVDWHSKY